VKIRTVAGASEERRVEGQLVSADDSGVVVRTEAAEDGTAVEQRLAYHDIERARTVFEWGPATPRSGKRKSDEMRERKQ
jgi:ribosome maturation factor RimP